MTPYTLTLLDTTGIQDYIFGSNRLQENIGASELVYRATSLWVFKALEEAGLSHNIQNPNSLDWDFKPDVTIEHVQAEVLQAAGGNTFILFQNREKARDFVQHLTLRLLKDAPGLTVLAQHLDDFDFANERLPDKRLELFQKMQAHKISRPSSAPTLGMSVTAGCDSTGLPAVHTLAGIIDDEPLGLPGEDDGMLVSSEVTAKRLARKHANLRLRALLKNAADDFEFPYDLEKLGRFKGEESTIAVIHADGNHMGKRVREIGDKFTGNRTYIHDLRDLSRKINATSLSALETVVGLVVQAVKRGDIPFVEEDNKKYLPFRPLVFGGDDVTFVCNGLIGVSLAARYLEAFEKAALENGLDMHASAGVSIVKLHYPFARAYSLSEELIGSAKSLTREPNPDCSALDWHFAQSGLSGGLEAIRKREYLSDEGQSLVLRPLSLAGEGGSLKKLESVLAEFEDDYWGRKHNKVIGLREPLRKGPKFVQQYRLDFDLKELPEIAGKTASETGWMDSTCWYFDAVELLDHHVSLK